MCITTHSLTSHKNYRNRRGPHKNTGKSRRRARRAKKNTQQRSSRALSKELGYDVDNYRNGTDTSWEDDIVQVIDNKNYPEIAKYESFLLAKLQHLESPIDQLLEPSSEAETDLTDSLDSKNDLIPLVGDTDKNTSSYEKRNPSTSPSIEPSSEPPTNKSIKLNNPFQLGNVLFPQVRPFSKKSRAETFFKAACPFENLLAKSISSTLPLANALFPLTCHLFKKSYAETIFDSVSSSVKFLARTFSDSSSSTLPLANALIPHTSSSSRTSYADQFFDVALVTPPEKNSTAADQFLCISPTKFQAHKRPSSRIRLLPLVNVLFPFSSPLATQSGAEQFFTAASATPFASAKFFWLKPENFRAQKKYNPSTQIQTRENLLIPPDSLKKFSVKKLHGAASSTLLKKNSFTTELPISPTPKISPQYFHNQKITSSKCLQLPEISFPTSVILHSIKKACKTPPNLAILSPRTSSLPFHAYISQKCYPPPA